MSWPVTHQSNGFTATTASARRLLMIQQRKETLLSDATTIPIAASARIASLTVLLQGVQYLFQLLPGALSYQNDKLVRVTGNEDDPLWRGKICPKSQFYCNFITAQNGSRRRLNVWGTRRRQFEPISWDQALDEIAAKLQGVKDEFGPESLAIFAGTRTGTLTRRGYIRLLHNYGVRRILAIPKRFVRKPSGCLFKQPWGLAAVVTAIPKVILVVRRSMFILVIIRQKPVRCILA